MLDLKIKKIIETLLEICFVGERGEAPNGNTTYLDAGYAGLLSSSFRFCSDVSQPRTAIGILLKRLKYRFVCTIKSS